MHYISLDAPQRMATYRKLAVSTWQHPRDPTTYAALDLPVGNAEAFLANATFSPKPTLTHFVSLIMAHCLEHYPNLNHVLRFHRLYPRTNVDVFVTTMTRSGDQKDLAGFVIRRAETMGLEGFASACEHGVTALRKGEDPVAIRAQTFLSDTPGWLLGPLTRIMDFFQYDLNISLARLGLPPDPFGSFIVTNIGALGIERAFVPLSPYSRCPLLVCIGKPHEVPAVRNGNVEVGRSVNIGITFDHRHADGAHCGLMLRRFKKIFDRPEAFPKVFLAREDALDETPSA